MLTKSLCPICKKIINATINVGKNVIMSKICDEHGAFSSILEKSPKWFEFCRNNNSPKIYDGFMIDITKSCNIACQYCYHDNSGEHCKTDSILHQIEHFKQYAPIILTGGEPTLHPDIDKILMAAALTGQYWLLTNGIKLSDPVFFNRLLPYLDCSGVLMVGLSFHKESNGADLRFLDLCREHKKRIGTSFYVIDDLTQINDALAIYDKYADVICSIRIKSASNLGQETRAKKRIYTSEMVNDILRRGGQIDMRYSNKISYASMLLGNKEIRLICWYDKENIDLLDIDGPPYCLDNNGNIHNLVTSCILDEPCMQ